MITQNDFYFILSLICMGCSAFFLPMALYIMPAAWLGWVYQIPDFVFAINSWAQSVFNVDENVASWIVVDLFFILFLLFSAASYYFSVKANEGFHKASQETSVNEDALRSYREKQEQRETIMLVVKMILIIGLVFVVAELVHNAITFKPVQ